MERPVKVNSAWSEVKKNVKERPALLYILNVPIDRVHNFCSIRPSDEEIYKYRELILKDRQERTFYVRRNLQKVVSYRDCVNMSKKMGISDTSLRDIIEGKNNTATYQMLDKIELFLSTIKDLNFTISLTNNLTLQNFLNDEFCKASKKLKLSSYRILEITYELNRIAQKPNSTAIDILHRLNFYSEELSNIEKQLSPLIETFCNDDLI